MNINPSSKFDEIKLSSIEDFADPKKKESINPLVDENEESLTFSIFLKNQSKNKSLAENNGISKKRIFDSVDSETKIKCQKLTISYLNSTEIDNKTSSLSTQKIEETLSHEVIFHKSLAINFNFLCLFFSEQSGMQDYEDIKNLLIKDPLIKFEYNDQESTLSFFCTPKEIEAICIKYDIKNLNYFINLSTYPSSILTTTMNGNQYNGNIKDHKKFLKDLNALVSEGKKLIDSIKPSFIDVIPSSDAVDKQIINLLQNYPGICIGERHRDVSSKKFIIEHMQEFAKQGVTTLYLEHLPFDSIQPLLDEYFNSQSDQMPSYLKEYLDILDNGFYFNRQNSLHPYGFYEIVKSAKENNLKIIGIDTTLSYISGTSHKYGVIDIEKRLVAMNSVAIYHIQKMQNQQAKEKNQAGKYLIFVGSAHISTNHSVAGLADLLSIPSLIIEDKDILQEKDLNSTLSIEYNVKNLHRTADEEGIAHVGMYIRMLVS